MSNRLWWRILSTAAACAAVISIGACSTPTAMDGGIVGTGHGIDCEAQAKKDGTGASLPEECKREKGQ